MSMTYVHSQYMEGAGWWGQWWEGRNGGSKEDGKKKQRPKPLATGAGIRYTENRSEEGRIGTASTA
jgi:hypothetical protein